MLTKQFSEILFNSFPEALCVVNENGEITYFNNKFSEAFQTSAIIINKNFSSLFHTDHREEINKILSAGFEIQKSDNTIEKEFRLNDKRKIWFEFSFSIINTSEKKLLGVLIKDITNRKIFELELSKSEGKYRNVFNQANDAMFICYLNYGEMMGNFIDVNEVACNNLGFSKEELFNMSPSSLMFNNLEVEVIKIVESLWKDKHIIFLSSCCTKAGKKIPNEISAHLFDLDNRPAALFIARDLSQREEAESKIQQASVKLRNLALHLQNIREEERALIAREIHDELGQILTYLKIQLTLAGKKIIDDSELARSKIESSLKLIDESVEAVQRITSQLRPALLDELGLAAAIDWQAQDFSNRTGINFSAELPKEEPGLNREKLTAVFRIFQEALTNVARHANATKVFIRMIEYKNNLILEIKDNGKGITMSQVNNPKSLGLLGMKERALVFGGSVIIKSSMKSATTVRVEVPME